LAWSSRFSKLSHGGNAYYVKQLARTYGISLSRLAELDNQEPQVFVKWLQEHNGISVYDAVRLADLLEREKGQKIEAENRSASNQVD